MISHVLLDNENAIVRQKNGIYHNTSNTKICCFFFNLQQNVLTMMVQYLKLRLLASEPTRVFEREKQQINGEGKGAKKWLVPDYCS